MNQNQFKENKDTKTKQLYNDVEAEVIKFSPLKTKKELQQCQK